MGRTLFLLAALLLPTMASAEPAGKPASVVVPVRTIPLGSVIRAEDVMLQAALQVPPSDIAQSLAAVVGKETRRALYANRPIRSGEIGPVTLVDRNARVTLRFRYGPIELTTMGRAMEAGGIGQMIRVMNLDSRRTIYGRISGPEVVDVGS
jgi:flagellar basal body P-ring formation protein FlgA